MAAAAAAPAPSAPTSHARWRATAGGGRGATEVGGRGGGARSIISFFAIHAC